MIVPLQFRQGADLDALVHQHRNTVADRREAVQVVGDHDHGEAEAALQA